jgi:hypothetical protein
VGRSGCVPPWSIASLLGIVNFLKHQQAKRQAFPQLLALSYIGDFARHSPGGLPHLATCNMWFIAGRNSLLQVATVYCRSQHYILQVTTVYCRSQQSIAGRNTTYCRSQQPIALSSYHHDWRWRPPSPHERHARPRHGRPRWARLSQNWTPVVQAKHWRKHSAMPWQRAFKFQQLLGRPRWARFVPRHASATPLQRPRFVAAVCVAARRHRRPPQTTSHNISLPAAT